MPRRLGKAGESLLVEAVQSVLDDVSEGVDATAAVIKAATRLNLPPMMTRLLTQQYNTGRSLFQHEAAGGVLEKLGEFDLVRIEDVMQHLYPKDKAAHLIDRSQNDVVSDDYRSGFVAPPAVEVRKSAGLLVPTKTCPEKTSPGLSEREIYRLKMEVFSGLDKIAAQLRKTKDIKSLMYYAEQLCGPEAIPVLEMAASSTQLDKAAIRSEAWPAEARPESVESEPYRTIARIIEISDILSKQAVQVDPQKGPKDINRGNRRRLQSSGPTKPTPGPNTQIKSKAGPGWGTNLFGMGQLAYGHVLSRAAGGSATPDAYTPEDDVRLLLSDPSVAQEQKEIDALLTIREISDNDEVLQEVDDADLIAAYNELSQLAPRAIQRTGAARALLRNYVANGGLSSQDVSAILQMESWLAGRAPSRQ